MSNSSLKQSLQNRLSKPPAELLSTLPNLLSSPPIPDLEEWVSLLLDLVDQLDQMSNEREMCWIGKVVAETIPEVLKMVVSVRMMVELIGRIDIGKGFAIQVIYRCGMIVNGILLHIRICENRDDQVVEMLEQLNTKLHQVYAQLFQLLRPSSELLPRDTKAIEKNTRQALIGVWAHKERFEAEIGRLYFGLQRPEALSIDILPGARVKKAAVGQLYGTRKTRSETHLPARSNSDDLYARQTPVQTGDGQ